MKSQSTIISTILLSSIILSIVTATYIWGQPLVQKTTDRIKIETLSETLMTIKNAIDNAQQTGSPTQVLVELSDAGIIIRPEQNSISIETRTIIPIITSYTFVPISYIELPFENELIDVNTTLLNTTQAFIPAGYVSGTDIHFGSQVLNATLYNFTVYDTASAPNYDTICIYLGASAVQDDCLTEGQSIVKDAITYTLSWIDSAGEEVILTGPEAENIGVLGTDPGGIIIAKSSPVSRTQQVELRLTYRGLIDASGRLTKTIIECTSGCRTGEGRKTLKINRDRIVRTENITYFYIRMRFE